MARASNTSYFHLNKVIIYDFTSFRRYWMYLGTQPWGTRTLFIKRDHCFFLARNIVSTPRQISMAEFNSVPPDTCFFLTPPHFKIWNWKLFLPAERGGRDWYCERGCVDSSWGEKQPTRFRSISSTTKHSSALTQFLTL